MVIGRNNVARQDDVAKRDEDKDKVRMWNMICGKNENVTICFKAGSHDVDDVMTMLQMLPNIHIAHYQTLFLITSFVGVGLKPLKVRHNVIKLDLIIPLLSLWCIDIDLSIQLMSLTLYMTWVHQELHRRCKSWVPYKQISLVHRF